MEMDNLDRQLDRLLRAGIQPPPTGLADRIARHATAQPQQGGWNIRIRLVLSELASPWPSDLLAKSAVLAMLALLTFGSGAVTSYHAPDTEEPTFTAMIYGENDDLEIF